jgi:hypothetical protein
MENNNQDYVHDYSAREKERLMDQAINASMMKESDWEKGIRDLYRTTEKDGTFCYTFFKGLAFKQD